MGQFGGQSLKRKNLLLKNMLMGLKIQKIGLILLDMSS